MQTTMQSISRSFSTPADPAGRGIRLTSYTEAQGAPVARVEPSQARMVLLVLLSDRLTVRCGGAAVHFDCPGAFVVPAGSGAVHTRHPGNLSCIEASLPPWAFVPILGDPGPRPGDIVKAEDLIGADADRLLKLAGTGAATPARLALVADFLFRTSRRADWAPRWQIRFAWSRLVRSGGTTPVSTLAACVGWSERYLATQFHGTTGLLPKTAARLLRFDRAYRQVTRTSRPLATIAAACGFADQAHMTREFVHHAGRAPGAVRQARLDGLPGVAAR